MKEQLQYFMELVLKYMWLVETCFFSLLFILLFFAWLKITRLTNNYIARTQEQWQGGLASALINATKTPIAVLISLIGLQQVGNAVLGIFELPILNKWVQHTRFATFLIIFFWVLLRFISQVENVYRRKTIAVGDKKIDGGTLSSFFRVARAIVFLTAALTIMEIAGISISGFLAFGGIGGIILGFAAKDTLSNVFSGLLIFWERPFVIGDWIRQPDANIEGVVETIGWRTTQIRTFDKRPLYVPNSLFFNSVIENPQRMSNRRIYEYIGLRYDDIDKLPTVLNAVRELLKNHTEIAPDQIQMVNFDRYSESSVDFFIYAMTKTTDWRKFHQVKEEILLGIARIIHENGCQFAFPTRTIHHVYDDNHPHQSASLTIGE